MFCLANSPVSGVEDQLTPAPPDRIKVNRTQGKEKGRKKGILIECRSSFTMIEAYKHNWVYSATDQAKRNYGSRSGASKHNKRLR